MNNSYYSEKILYSLIKNQWVPFVCQAVLGAGDGAVNKQNPAFMELIPLRGRRSKTVNKLSRISNKRNIKHVK